MKFYKYLFYCLYCLVGKNESVYVRVSSLLSVGSSFILMSIYLFVKILILQRLSSSLENFIAIVGIFICNYVFHLIYFLRKKRCECIVVSFENNKSKPISAFIGATFIVFSFLFLIFTFYVLGGTVSKLIESQ
jgi:hypothetical protein